MKKISMVLIGAGDRGMDAHGLYALNNPHELKFVAVAEPDKERREKFCSMHKIEKNMSFESYEDVLSKPALADAALICTQDRMHFDPTIKALEKGYHVLLEKPMSTDPIECIKMGEFAAKYRRILTICHVLRYTRFFSMLKKLLKDGRIGDLVSIQHNENVGYWHFAHSYVRGNWRNAATASPIILAKSCHDLDIMLWLAESDCKNVSSFGKLSHFAKENAPLNAPDRCLDGCRYNIECAFSADKIYLTENTCWPTSVISNDTSIEARIKALKEGPYGRCVYKCDNNVVDHQVVNIEFDNGITAAFTLSAFTNEWCRTIKLMGTKGEIRGKMEKDEIEVVEFSTGRSDLIRLKGSNTGHFGGDSGLMRDFISLVNGDSLNEGLTSASVSVQSHLMAFAAEKARMESKVINMKKYMEELRKC